MVEKPLLKVELGRGLVLRNPVMNASGTFAYGEEFSRIMDLSSMGAVVTKGLSLKPKEGNPTPRVAEAASGMVNAIGLENVGLDVFLSEKLPFLDKYGTPVIVNFFGNTEEEYSQMAEGLNVPGVAALEMNVSCPNVKRGGLQFGTDPDVLGSLVCAVRTKTDKPLIVKLSPMSSDICRMALSAQEAGADALTCINTIPAMIIDEKTMRPVLGNLTGGLSGPAIKPVALKVVWDVSRAVKIPVIGAGGIATYRDAVQFMLAGASAVQVGTQLLVEPFSLPGIIEGISGYLSDNNISELGDIVGKLKVPELANTCK
jgi:dihydroorotate dehydrogenase (NAD+) catalytic subunit